MHLEHVKWASDAITYFSLKLMGREGHPCMVCSCEFIECAGLDCHVWQFSYDPSQLKMLCYKIQKPEECRCFLTLGTEIGLYVNTD